MICVIKLASHNPFCDWAKAYLRWLEFDAVKTIPTWTYDCGWFGIKAITGHPWLGLWLGILPTLLARTIPTHHHINVYRYTLVWDDAGSGHQLMGYLDWLCIWVNIQYADGFPTEICCLTSYSHPARYGPLYTLFDNDWPLRDTQTFIRECLPADPNPLVTVEGFSVEMLPLVI